MTTQEEWNTLLIFVTPSYQTILDPKQTHSLKALDSWIYNEKDYAPTNTTGFSVLSTSCQYGYNGEDMGQCAAFISTTYSDERYSGINFYYWKDDVDIGGRKFDIKASVRCVENAVP